MRTTDWGCVAGKLGVLVEVNCESDFVARTEDFQALVSDIANHIATTKPKCVRVADVTEAERANFKQHEALYEQKFAGEHGGTIGDLVKSKIAKLGENINVSRFILYEVSGNGVVGSYIHTGGQIGVHGQGFFQTAALPHQHLRLLLVSPHAGIADLFFDFC